jgi:hypothetical protein
LEILTVAATANMILKISTMADLSGIKAGIDMVLALGKQVKETMAAVDAFSDAHSRLSLDVSKMISSTQGLISAQQAYQTANKLASAGINATATQLEGLGKKAAEYAQATGQEIPAALEQMTSAVIAGSERGLRQFGVELNGSTDKLANANTALDAFTESTKNTSMAIDDLSDILAALDNNLSDAAKRIIEVSGASGGLASVFVGLNDALTEFNLNMERSDNAAETLARTIRGTLYQAVANVASIFGATDIEETFNTAAMNIARGEGLAQSEAAKERAGKASMEFTEEEIYGPKKKKGKGGGGGRKAGSIEMEFTEEELYGESDSQIVDRLMAEERQKLDYSDRDVEELTGISLGPLGTGDDSDAALAAMSEYMDARAMQMEAEVGFAQSFSDAWEQSLGKVSSGAIAAAGAQNLLRGAVTMVANAALGSGKITVKAVTDMVKGVASAIGIEATIRAVMELGLGIGKLASSYGADPTAELHFAAAAQHAITAALAFAVAGGASAIGNAAGGGKGGSSSPTGTQTGQGQYGSPGYASVGGQQQQNVVIVLEGDAGGVFRVVEDENRKRRYSGQSAFGSA